MLGKGSKLYSIINNKCPRCQEGDFFVSGKAYDFKNFSVMNHSCEKCDLSFEQEPGYYYGAMYVSYAINVALMVSVWVAYMVLFDDRFSIWWMVFASMILGIIMAPLTFRLARLTWINFFIRYRGESVIGMPEKVTGK
jgi:uncharacterized protein (DUF983 family)